MRKTKLKRNDIRSPVILSIQFIVHCCHPRSKVKSCSLQWKQLNQWQSNEHTLRKKQISLLKKAMKAICGPNQLHQQLAWMIFQNSNVRNSTTCCLSKRKPITSSGLGPIHSKLVKWSLEALIIHIHYLIWFLVDHKPITQL